MAHDPMKKVFSLGCEGFAQFPKMPMRLTWEDAGRSSAPRPKNTRNWAKYGSERRDQARPGERGRFQKEHRNCTVLVFSRYFTV
jgi:hypothetical protein